MGSLSIWHWLIVLAVVLIVFGGGGKISRIMGDMAKGVNAFKKGLKEEEGQAASSETPKIVPPGGAPQAAGHDPVVHRDDAARN